VDLAAPPLPRVDSGDDAAMCALPLRVSSSLSAALDAATRRTLPGSPLLLASARTTDGAGDRLVRSAGLSCGLALFLSGEAESPPVCDALMEREESSGDPVEGTADVLAARMAVYLSRRSSTSLSSSGFDVLKFTMPSPCAHRDEEERPQDECSDVQMHHKQSIH